MKEAGIPGGVVRFEQLRSLAGELKNRGQWVQSFKVALELVRIHPFSGSGYWALARALTPGAALNAKRALGRTVGRAQVPRMAKGALLRLLGSAGRLLSAISRDDNPGQLFLLFRNADVGGAERVHAQIVQALAERKPWVYFSERGVDNGLLPDYGSAGRIVDAAGRAAGRVKGWIYAGYLAGIINRHAHPVVLGCNSRLFYWVVPLLAPHVRCVDLRHAFELVHEEASSRHVKRLDARVVISKEHSRLREEFYRARRIGDALLRRNVTIENGVSLGSREGRNSMAPELLVLFIGRGAPEKRVHLAGAVAAECRGRGVRARFVFAGPAPEWVAPEHRSSCTFLGLVNDPREVERLYREAHIIILTSKFEGMPLVIQEAMAHGVVPIVTRCGALGEHLDGSNGLIVENDNEASIVAAMVQAVERLASDRALLENMSEAAWQYAQKRFTAPDFAAKWRLVLLGESAAHAEKSQVDLPGDAAS